MNKDELYTAIYRKTRMPKWQIALALDALSEVIADALASGDRVHIAGLGSFEAKDRAPRVGRNPHKNEPVFIPAKRAPVFKASKILKTAVEGK